MKGKCLSVDEIANLIGGAVFGSGSCLIDGVADIESAKKHEITFVSSKKYINFIESSNAGCVIVDQNTEIEGRTFIRVDNPYSILPKLLSGIYEVNKSFPAEISDLSFVGKNAIISSDVSIFPFAYIGDGCKIGRGTVIYSGVHIGDGTVIGENTVIHPNVSVYHEAVIGSRVIIHSGSVIGADGFGYVQEDDKSVKIPQIGNVVIEDDVEIGANVDIDRATIGSTKIGKGSKIDNLVQIAHNVEIGKECIVISQTGISGSTKLGKRVFLGGQVGVVGHVSIGDFSKIAAKSGISKSVPPNSVWGGEVGQPIMKWKRLHAASKRLPALQGEVKDLKIKLKKLEETVSNLIT